MSKAESRKVNIVKGSIAQFFLSDSELFLETKFGDLEKKEKAEVAKIRAKAIKEFTEDMTDVYSVDSEKVQDIGAELIAELAVTMNSTLSDLVKALMDNKTKSTKKRKANDGDNLVTTKIDVKKNKIIGKKAK